MINESSRPLYRGAQVVWYALFVVEGLLGMRFALKLFQANPDAFFTGLIYNLTSVFVYPFVTVFQNASMQGSVLEWTTLLAMLIYWLLAVAAIKLFVMSKPVSAVEADSRLTEDNLT